MLRSHRLVATKNFANAVGQIGGHIARGFAHPKGQRTGKPMALVSALPLEPGSDRMVLAFMDRSDPVETYDNRPGSGDNAVVVVNKSEVFTSIVRGVCVGDIRGVKVELGDELKEPEDVNTDPTALTMAEYDNWLELVDENGLDCSKLGGYPIWTARPEDVEKAAGKKQIFHHRISADLIDFKLGEGAVIYVFLDEDKQAGTLCWIRSGGGAETTYSHY
jgi:hypothetical protein